VLQSKPMAGVLILLASNSPRRRQLLSLSGFDFQVWPANIDESRDENEAPEAYARRLAQTKVREVADRRADLPLPYRIANLVLAADTIVVDGKEVLGKPVDQQDADRMLRQLRGREHQVYTALALVDVARGSLITDVCITQVPMRAYPEDEISAYIASGDPLDKAGAYAIQHGGFHPVADLAGCYASVMGLPLCHMLRMLAQVGVVPERDVPGACQIALAYHCPISADILAGKRVG
jgi:septum formation protein